MRHDGSDEQAIIPIAFSLEVVSTKQREKEDMKEGEIVLSAKKFARILWRLYLSKFFRV